MISHMIEKYIHNDEKKLALKISLASSVIFFVILVLIIGSSYMYQRNATYREFMAENRIIQNRESLPEIGKNIPISTITPIGPSKEGGRRGPRDIIIFNAQKQIIKNDFLNLGTEDINQLYWLALNKVHKIEFEWHTYLVAKNTIGDTTVLLFRDLSPIYDFHISLIFIALIGSGIILFIIFLLSLYLARITIAPIRAQSRELESYSHNVAHELRTPLSVMRSNLELLRIKPESRFIESTDEEISSMERIIDSLLFLAKPTESFEKNPLNITKKTGEIIERYKGQSEIQYTHEKRHTQVQINEELYNRIICNLIENAIKYKSEWDIQIHISKNNIQISNQIDSIFNEDELKNITKVFYQWDQSRSSSGYGLWLALVQKIIDISGWKMQISTKNKEFVVEISF